MFAALRMKRIAVCTLLLLTCVSGFTQITSSIAEFTEDTKYFLDNDSIQVEVRQDPIYVFYDSMTSLTAAEPNGKEAKFIWEKIDSLGYPFTFTPILVDTSDWKYTSTLDSIPYGCYRVRLDTPRMVMLDSSIFDLVIDSINNEVSPPDTIYDTIYHYTKIRAIADTLRAWVIIDSFSVDTIYSEQYKCENPSLNAEYYPNKYDPLYSYQYLNMYSESKVFLPIPSGFTYYITKVKWTPSRDIHEGAEDIEIDDPSWDENFYTSIPKPLYDATYKLELENYFGNKASKESDTIKAVAVYAKFDALVEKTDDAGFPSWVGISEEGEDSPASIKLQNATINANEDGQFTWIFYDNQYNSNRVPTPPDSAWFVVIDSINGSNPTEEIIPPLSPYKPGQHPISMVAVNKYGCTDADTVILIVNDFLIKEEAIPSVFTPNGDGINDIFELRDVESNVRSVTKFEISVLNQWGQLYFHSRDINFKWDGKIKGTNSMAPSGVYFYIIKAEGLDRNQKKVKQKFKGNVHVFDSRN